MAGTVENVARKALFCRLTWLGSGVFYEPAQLVLEAMRVGSISHDGDHLFCVNRFYTLEVPGRAKDSSQPFVMEVPTVVHTLGLSARGLATMLHESQVLHADWKRSDVREEFFWRFAEQCIAVINSEPLLPHLTLAHRSSWRCTMVHTR